MVFSSFEFLFRFLPVFLFFYYTAPKNWKNFILFAGSIVFYTAGEAEYVLLLFVCVLVNYLFGRFMYVNIDEGRGVKQTVLLTLALCYDFGVLFYFKYSGLAGRLPLGISFYTFQIAAYIIDVYRGKVPAEKSFIQGKSKRISAYRSATARTRSHTFRHEVHEYEYQYYWTEVPENLHQVASLLVIHLYLRLSLRHEGGVPCIDLLLYFIGRRYGGLQLHFSLNAGLSIEIMLLRGLFGQKSLGHALLGKNLNLTDVSLKRRGLKLRPVDILGLRAVLKIVQREKRHYYQAIHPIHGKQRTFTLIIIFILILFRWHDAH